LLLREEKNSAARPGKKKGRYITSMIREGEGKPYIVADKERWMGGIGLYLGGERGKKKGMVSSNKVGKRIR